MTYGNVTRWRGEVLDYMLAQKADGFLTGESHLRGPDLTRACKALEDQGYHVNGDEGLTGASRQLGSQPPSLKELRNLAMAVANNLPGGAAHHGGTPKFLLASFVFSGSFEASSWNGQSC